MDKKQMELNVSTWMSKKPKITNPGRIQQAIKYYGEKSPSTRLTHYNSGRKLGKTLKIKQDLFELLESCRKRRMEMYSSGRSGYTNKPICFLVGADKKEVLKLMIPLPSSGGCYQMPKIYPNELAMAFTELLTLKHTPIAIVRIGLFDPYHTDSRGPVLGDIDKFSKNFYLISLGIGTGISGMRIEKGNRTHTTRDVGWETVK